MIGFDFETIPLPFEEREQFRPSEGDVKYGNTKDPEKLKAKYELVLTSWAESCALHAHTGRIACIGLYDGSKFLWFGHDNESDMLSSFWTYIIEEPPPYVGHNIFGFDLPFIAKRSRILRVDIPSRFEKLLGLPAYRVTDFKDTMIEWQFGQKGEMISLKHLAGIFGIPVKEGKVTGKEFYKFWNEGEDQDRDACIKYLEQDCVATYQIAERLHLDI